MSSPPTATLESLAAHGSLADTPTRMLLELLRAGQRVRFVARGASMWPTVRDGALVEVTPCPGDTLQPGDLGAYGSPAGMLVVHRVVTAVPGALVFAGDALVGPDPTVALRDVLGRAVVLSQPRVHFRWPSRRHLRPLFLRTLEWFRARGRRTP